MPVQKLLVPLHSQLSREAIAQMAESVDALVSNTSGAIHPGSIPGLGTKSCKFSTCGSFFCFCTSYRLVYWHQRLLSLYFQTQPRYFPSPFTFSLETPINKGERGVKSGSEPFTTLHPSSPYYIIDREFLRIYLSMRDTIRPYFTMIFLPFTM